MEIEVSKKVRAAIKAKLVELGVHVDEELPDYVMVLVANRRSRIQMEQDLNLFLADNTNRFVIWLHHVLKKLDEVTAHLPLAETKKRKSSVEQVSSSKKCKKAEEMVKEVTSERKEDEKKLQNCGAEEMKVEVVDVKKEIMKRPMITTEDPPPPKLSKQGFKFTMKRNKKIGKSSLAEDEDLPATPKLTLLDPDNDDEFISLDVHSNEFEFDELESLRQVALDSKSEKSREIIKVKSLPQQEPHKLSPEINQSDEIDKSVTKLAALEASLQSDPKSDKSPDKSHRPKSVEKCERRTEKCSEKEKSVGPKKKVAEKFAASPTPEKSSKQSDRFYRAPRPSQRSQEKHKSETSSGKCRASEVSLFSRSRAKREERVNSAEVKRERKSRDLKLQRLKSVIQVESDAPPKKMKSQVVRKDEEYDPSKPIISTKKLAVNNLILKAVAEAQKSVTEYAIQECAKRKPSIKDRLGKFEVEPYSEQDLKKIVIKVPTSPKLKERINIRVDSTEESSDEEYEIIEEIVEQDGSKETTDTMDTADLKTTIGDGQGISMTIQSSPKVILNQRPVERPLQSVKPLKLPSLVTKEPAQCKYWPTCSFKEKCVFPHPKCKFGGKCSKPDCPYKHDKDVCKFFPNCHSLSCHFYHPSPCRFGNGCKDKKCVLYHPGRTATANTLTNFQNFSFPNFNPPPTVPAKHLLTWKKN